MNTIPNWRHIARYGAVALGILVGWIERSNHISAYDEAVERAARIREQKAAQKVEEKFQTNDDSWSSPKCIFSISKLIH